jgi:hypothetical protein
MLAKYSSLQEAEQALWNFTPDAAYFRSVHRLFRFSEKLHPPVCQAGLLKFASGEEAGEQRLAAEIDQAVRKATRLRRGQAKGK